MILRIWRSKRSFFKRSEQLYSLHCGGKNSNNRRTNSKCPVTPTYWMVKTLSLDGSLRIFFCPSHQAMMWMSMVVPVPITLKSHKIRFENVLSISIGLGVSQYQFSLPSFFGLFSCWTTTSLSSLAFILTLSCWIAIIIQAPFKIASVNCSHFFPSWSYFNQNPNICVSDFTWNQESAP